MSWRAPRNHGAAERVKASLTRSQSGASSRAGLSWAVSCVCLACWLCALSCEVMPSRSALGSRRTTDLAPLTASFAVASEQTVRRVVDARPALTARPALQPTAAVVAIPSTAELFIGTALPTDEILHGLAHAGLRSFRPVGNTSTVFRSALDAPFRAAFKAATQKRPFAAVAEVAAYRMARCLGLSSVPPAVLRRVDADAIQRDLEPEFSARWPDIATRLQTENGSVEVAAIYWIEGLRDLEIATGDTRASYQRMLQLAEPLPTPVPPLAAQLSDMNAFDYLIGNWDRWSGGNVKGDASGKILYVRDHDAGFAARLSDQTQRHLLDRLLSTERFSRGFIARVSALTRADFERELGKDPGFAGRRRLGEQRMSALFERRATLLSYVQALIDQYGEARVLAFP
jgi:hypothetical protein